MSENKPELNPDKTEFIGFCAKDRYKWLVIWVFCLMLQFDV